jgi:catechol 2,3-dioxygenase-like lactoylglutathione lyase family enzyme
MAIDNVIVHVADVGRSVDFYSGLLGGVPQGGPTEHAAVLDFLTATIELRRLDGGVPSPWQEDDEVTGFRHIGFKVAAVDPLVARLKAAGVPFRLEPVDAAGDVRIAFFVDPDGTVLEVVEGDLQYHEVFDADGVAAERALGVPARPRFDHVASTVHDVVATAAAYAPLGFSRTGALLFDGDPRGFRIDYLKAGDSVIEVFTFAEPVRPGTVRTDSYGFVAVELSGGGSVAGATSLGEAGGRRVVVDADRLALATAR